MVYEDIDSWVRAYIRIIYDFQDTLTSLENLPDNNVENRFLWLKISMN
jgi:hypothetical protein